MRMERFGNIAAVATTVVTLSFAYAFIPPLWLFLRGIESGMTWIDHIYPYPQSRQPFYDNPVLIYAHMYLNIPALGLQILLISFFHPPYCSLARHRRLAWAYTSLIVPGTISSTLYAHKQRWGSDGGKSGFFAFVVMGLVTVTTLCTTLYYMYVRPNITLHREWSIRHFAVVFGNGVVFRILANTYLVRMVAWDADFYASWCQMIHLSWAIPLFVAEQYLAWERTGRPKITDESKIVLDKLLQKRS